MRTHLTVEIVLNPLVLLSSPYLVLCSVSSSLCVLSVSVSLALSLFVSLALAPAPATKLRGRKVRDAGVREEGPQSPVPDGAGRLSRHGHGKILQVGLVQLALWNKRVCSLMFCVQRSYC